MPGCGDRIIENEWFVSWWVQRCFFALQLIERHWDLIVYIFIGRCLSAVWKRPLKFYSGQNSLPSFLLKTGIADLSDYLSAKLHHDEAIFIRRCLSEVWKNLLEFYSRYNTFLLFSLRLEQQISLIIYLLNNHHDEAIFIRRCLSAI
jgi:hypothetical protein